MIGSINVCLDLEMFQMYMRLEERPKMQRSNFQTQTCQHILSCHMRGFVSYEFTFWNVPSPMLSWSWFIGENGCVQITQGIEVQTRIVKAMDNIVSEGPNVRMINHWLLFHFFMVCEFSNLFWCMICVLVDMLSIGWWCNLVDVCHEYKLKCMLWMLGWSSLILARLCSDEFQIYAIDSSIKKNKWCFASR